MPREIKGTSKEIKGMSKEINGIHKEIKGQPKDIRVFCPGSQYFCIGFCLPAAATLPLTGANPIWDQFETPHRIIY